MVRILINTPTIAGHRLEYIHHFYVKAVAMPYVDFIFLLPLSFKSDSKILDWPSAGNIKVLLHDYENINSKKWSFLKRSVSYCKLLNYYAKEYDVSEVVLVSLMDYMPLLPFIVSNKVKISGIIYRVYLYDWKNENLLAKIKDVIINSLFCKCRAFDKIYVLNDRVAATYLNWLYNSVKFKYLPDPVPIFPNYMPRDLRKELGISNEKKVFLHPGGMLPYKGTLNILEALNKLEKDDASRVAFIFAGRADPIQPAFDDMFSKLKSKLQVIYINGYISFEQLADLFFTSDCVIIPYTTNNKSSGIIGNSAYFQKPVIVAKGGVIGKLVRKWKLGFLLDSPSSENIYRFLNNLPRLGKCSNSYAKDHSIEQFNRIIFEG